MNLSFLSKPFETVKIFFKRSWQQIVCLWKSLRTWWENLSHFWKDFCWNFACGVIIAIFLLLFEQQMPSLFHDIDDWGIDQVISWYRGISPPKDSYPFVVFDIDESTYREWGEPLLTPRDKLLQLLKLANAGRPKLIIVDIELSRPTEQDAELLTYLETYCQGQNQPTDFCPPVIFARALQTGLTKAGGELTYSVSKRTPFDTEAVTKSPYLHWGSTLFEPSSSGSLRRWNLWEATCQGDSSDPQPGTVIPSIQLLAAKLLKDTPNGVTELNNTLRQHFLPKDCANPQSEEEHHTASWWQSLTECINPPDKAAETAKVTVANDLTINLLPSHLNRRLIYTIPYQPEEGEARPVVQKGQAYLMTSFSAKWLLDYEKTLDPELTLLKNSVIVIGGSYEESGDIHATPLGFMPGYLVVINALHSLIQFGELKPMPPCIQYLGIELGLILIVSWIFAHPRFNSITAALGLGIIIAVILIPSSVLLFEYGVWLNFLLPLIGVMLHQLIAHFEELQELAECKKEKAELAKLRREP